MKLHDVKIESPYLDGVLKITPKQSMPVWLRVPQWAVDTVQFEGVSGAITLADGRAFIPECAAGQTITVRFDLPVQTLELKHRTRTIRATLRGDQTITKHNHHDPHSHLQPGQAGDTLV